MQAANVMVALEGDLGNTVPKYGVTPAEVAVLRAIHGDEAVFDIEPLDDEIEITSRIERDRLLQVYGKFVGGRDVSPVSELFPGVAARLFESFDELDLDDSFFKPAARVRAKPVDLPKAAEKAKRGKAKAAPEPEEADIEEMHDNVLG